MAKRNVDAWPRVMDKGEPVDAIVINASGCGTTVKDYGHMLKHDPELCRARRQDRRHDPRRHRVPRRLRHGPAQALVVAAGRLSLGLLHAARPAHHRRAAQAAAQRRLHGRRGAGGAPVLRLGRHLQHPPARDRRASCATARSPTSAACAPTSSPPATSAASPSSPAAWTSPSPTPSSCSTGPTAARSRAGWRPWRGRARRARRRGR